MITVKQFWQFVLCYFAFFAVMLITVFTFGRASVTNARDYSEDELFRLEIETIQARNEDPFFALMPQLDYTDFTDLIQRGQPNLVVRVTLTERLACTVYDPFGYYTNEWLGVTEWGADYPQAALYICTPYDCKIEEILIGDTEIFKEGDHFRFYAPYGIIDNCGVRYDGCPIFSEKRDYILFFSVLDVTGVGRWYDLTHPSAAVEIMAEDERTFYSLTEKGDALFNYVGFDVEELQEQLKRLYEETPYPLDIPSITPINPK